MKTYKRVDLCGTLELRKSGLKKSAIYKNGELVTKGDAYIVGQEWLKMKAENRKVV